MQFLAHDDAQALFPGPGQSVAAVQRPPDADLDGVARQDQPFLEGVIKGRAVIVGLAVVAGDCVAVRIKMHQSHRAKRGLDCPQHAQTDGVVSAQHHGHGPGSKQGDQPVADFVQAFRHIAGDGVDVAIVRHREPSADVHIQHRAVRFENGGGFAQGRRSETRPRPVRSAAVKRHAYHHNVRILHFVLPRVAHEGADAAEAGGLQGVYGGHRKTSLKMRVVRKKYDWAAR